MRNRSIILSVAQDLLNRSETQRNIQWTPAQREAILGETECILTHPSFKNSRRCVALFRHLVHHSLSGEADQFKERTLGIEVFGRVADYDTNADPIVRMTANEIRKRLAQRYQESVHQTVRIRLAAGNYIPHFDFVPEPPPDPLVRAFAVQSPQATIPSPPENLASEASNHSAKSGSEGRWKSQRIWWGVLSVLVLLLLAVIFYYQRPRSEQDKVWEPILRANEPVTVCVGEINALGPRMGAGWADIIARIIANRTFDPTPHDESQLPSVPLVDVRVVGRISSFLGAHHRDSIVRGANRLTLSDLREGPVVLVGEFDNPWSLILLSKFRFHVRVDPATQQEWIEDAQNPTKRDWKGSGLLSYSESSIDYALVTRALDPETGNWVLAVGGLGMHGTEAAADLILDPAYASLLATVERSSQRNFQIVLETSVIGGHAGPPVIIKIHTW